LKENKKGAPVTALIITNLCSQMFIFSTISQSIAQAFDFVIVVATLSYLTPYIIAVIYQLKLVVSGETYAGQGSARLVDGVIATLGTAYSLWVIQAGTSDLKTFGLGVGMVVVGIVFYPFVKKNDLRL
jgi:arginine:ornithine antiporter/lysine permease